MDYSYRRFSLDLTQRVSQETINAKKGDSKIRLVISVTENGYPFDLSNCNADFYAKTEENTIFDSCEIDGNQIEYTLSSGVTANAGLYDAEIRLYGTNGQLLTAPRFSFVVDETYIDEEAIEAEDSFTALTDALTAANTLDISVDGETITVTHKDGTTSEITVHSGVDGRSIWYANIYGQQSSVVLPKTNLPYAKAGDLFVDAVSNLFLITGESGENFTISYKSNIKGLRGERGIQGIQGVQGERGYGITDISSEDTEDGVKVTVTYADGETEEFELKNGTNGTNGTDGKSILYSSLSPVTTEGGTVLLHTSTIEGTVKIGDLIVTKNGWVCLALTVSSVANCTAMFNIIGKSADLPQTTNLLKGDGYGGASAATPGTDYLAPGALVWYRTYAEQDIIDGGKMDKLADGTLANQFVFTAANGAVKGSGFVHGGFVGDSAETQNIPSAALVRTFVEGKGYLTLDDLPRWTGVVE